LIEIIAVLVILGILAAVAIPRFMDLTTVAADKAAMQAVAEGKSRLSNQFARLLLNNPTLPSISSVVAVSTDAGDYILTFTPGTTNVKVKADGRPPNFKGSNSSYWRMPQ
jgi:type II secretory pathway pseudopilin PulG